ncbi:SAM-dependent methyltransferase [Saccharicrinis aurantiacus]|uniref:SAM-dependent methyltransferase n=1 Tax=Saccharicrinis aurantiacus TaxID=1849719 RepID=UPI00083951BD|nr:SAM-dependent methyltransferase [Saccharicrinis aurantiacus]
MKTKKGYISRIREDLRNAHKHSKTTIEKIAKGFGITNKNLVKEYTELAIVLNAREIAHDASLNTYEKYLAIVALYQSQVNLSMRTSMSVLMQQYSTPAPISFLASSYVRNPKQEALYLEPSAGNGLLTIALPYRKTFVNELDDIRLENLKEQPFAKVSSWDALKPPFAYNKKFEGVLTNPPFGTLSEAMLFGKFKIKRLEHAMALNALRCMKDDGKAAIIIGGHTSWDKQGRVSAGNNRIFLNYLYHFYNVEDIIPINGKKLYSRQGTSFNTRLILIDGAKYKPQGAAPLKNELHNTIVNSHEELWERVKLQKSPQASKTTKNSVVLIKTKAIRIKQKQLTQLLEFKNYEVLHFDVLTHLNSLKGVYDVKNLFENPNKHGDVVSHFSLKYAREDQWNFETARFVITWNNKSIFIPEIGQQTLPDTDIVKHIFHLLQERYPRLLKPNSK